MFTNEYIKYRRCLFFNETVYFSGVGKSGDAYTPGSNLPLDMGAIMKMGRCNQIAVKTQSSYSSTQANPGIYFGTGNTPATKADISLESVISSGLSITNPSSLVRVDDGNGKYTISAPFVVSNTSDAEINIWEIGAFSQFYYYASGLAGGAPMLFERTVLDAPVNIQPGESKLITYKVTFNQTLTVE